MEAIFSPDQKHAVDCVRDWIRSNSLLLTLGGVAGSGKSFLIPYFARIIKEEHGCNNIGFCAYTGRAAQVVRKKLRNSDYDTLSDKISTIHSLMYEPVICEETGDILDWIKVRDIGQDALIVDESSMVNRGILEHMMSFNVPILAIGDHAQLPPVSNDDDFNLMCSPDIVLENIHRQAAGSAIIGLSQAVRHGKRLGFGSYSDDVIRVKTDSKEHKQVIDRFFDPEHYNRDSIILCGTNKERVAYNRMVRRACNFDNEDIPQPNERVMCLKNNRYAKGGVICNGLLGTVISCEEDGEHHYFAEIEKDDGEGIYEGRISKYFFDKEKVKISDLPVSYKKIGDQFEYGYSTTVHKAQGSEFRRVLLNERSRWWSETPEDYARWLYTAITRSSEELFIVAAQ